MLRSDARRHATALGLLLLGAKVFAAPTVKPPAYIVCYHSQREPGLARECADKQERLNKCGYHAQLLNNATPEQLRLVAKQSPVGSAPIVITLGHGNCTCEGTDHRTTSDQLKQGSVETRSVKNAFSDARAETTLLAGQCFGGGLCNDCRCDGHSVGSVTSADAYALARTSAYEDFSYSSTPIVDEFLDLACDPTLFRKYADGNCVMSEKGFEKYYRESISYIDREFQFVAPLNENKTQNIPGGRGQSVWQLPVPNGEKNLHARLRELTQKIKKSAKFNSLPKSTLKIKTALKFFIYCNHNVEATWGETKYPLRSGLSAFGWFSDVKEATGRLNAVTPADSGCRVVEDPTEARVTLQVREPFELEGKPAHLMGAAANTADGYALANWEEKSFESLYLGAPLPAEASKEEKPTDKAIAQLDPLEKKLLPEKVLKKLPSYILSPDYSLMKFRHPFCHQDGKSAKADGISHAPPPALRPEEKSKVNHRSNGPSSPGPAN